MAFPFPAEYPTRIPWTRKFSTQQHNKSRYRLWPAHPHKYTWSTQHLTRVCDRASEDPSRAPTCCAIDTWRNCVCAVIQLPSVYGTYHLYSVHYTSPQLLHRSTVILHVLVNFNRHQERMPQHMWTIFCLMLNKHFETLELSFIYRYWILTHGQRAKSSNFQS